MEKIINLPAFPQSCDAQGFGGNVHEGMSMRDYFAAKALQALIAKGPLSLHSEADPTGSEIILMATATGAYKYADAMLAEREKEVGHV